MINKVYLRHRLCHTIAVIGHLEIVATDNNYAILKTRHNQYQLYV